MESIRIVNSVCEPEIDMNRRRRDHVAVGRVRRLIGTLFGFPPTLYMGTPRRSIDREQQQYSPSYE